MSSYLLDTTLGRSAPPNTSYWIGEFRENPFYRRAVRAFKCDRCVLWLPVHALTQESVPTGTDKLAISRQSVYRGRHRIHTSETSLRKIESNNLFPSPCEPIGPKSAPPTSAYSNRSARTGSIRAARRAGIQQAPSATTKSNPVTVEIVKGSLAEMP